MKGLRLSKHSLNLENMKGNKKDMINELKDLKGKKWVLDMDDTIAHFNKEEKALERFSSEKSFFSNLKPTKLLLYIQIAITTKVIDLNNIYIVSASPNEQADKDKQEWLNKYLKALPKENITFTRLGQNKADHFMKKYDLDNKDLSNYILIDDYTKNLVEWQKLGGKVLKYINEYNNTKQTYKQYNIKALQLD